METAILSGSCLRIKTVHYAWELGLQHEPGFDGILLNGHDGALRNCESGNKCICACYIVSIEIGCGNDFSNGNRME